jgi:hypothetical protein
MDAVIDADAAPADCVFERTAVVATAVATASPAAPFSTSRRFAPVDSSPLFMVSPSVGHPVEGRSEADRNSTASERWQNTTAFGLAIASGDVVAFNADYDVA